MFASAVSLYIFLHIFSSILTTPGTTENTTFTPEPTTSTATAIDTPESTTPETETTSSTETITDTPESTTPETENTSSTETITDTPESTTPETETTSSTETITVPGIVEELILTAYSHNISVNWKKPTEDNYCVEQYVIEWVHAESGNKNSSTASNEEELLVIEDLDACVEYEVSLRAVNDEIQGAEAVSNKTRTETVVPGIVEDLILTAYSHNISVNWKKPTVDSYCVEHYVIEWVHKVSGSKNSITASNEEDLLVIEDLDACVEYEVSVRAVNDEIQGAEAVSNKTRTETVVPGQVEDLNLAAYSHRISVNWAKPILTSYCVEQYVIEWVHAVSGSKNSSTASNEEDLLVIEDLDACVEYEVSVRAVNDENQSAEAFSNKAQTGRVVPGPVEDLSLTAYLHNISVNWKKPTEDSYCVEQYVIEWVHAVSGIKKSTTASNEEDLLVIEDLDACVEYEVSVRAVNDENQSAEAVSNKAKTGTVVPGPVEDLILTAYSHNISVNWKKPTVDSYCVEHYVIEWVHNVSGSKNSSTASNEEDLLVIEDLDACVEYEVSVRAVNDENQSAGAVTNKRRTRTFVEDLSLTAYLHNISVNWKKPTEDSYCVEQYVIEWVHAESGIKKSTTASNEEDLLVIEDLDACVEYEVSVRAVNDENQSAEAVSNKAKTGTVVPGIVEDLILTAYSHNISVNWKKPTVGSYCVEHYVIEWVHNVSGSKNSNTVSNEDLDACVEYEVSVRAVNDENQSAGAVTNKTRTRTVVPGPVEDLSLTAYLHNISVNWKKPTEDSYCVEQYVIEWVHTVSGIKKSTTASNEEDLLVIEDLDACVEYEVSVRAVNDENQSAEAVSNKAKTGTVVPGPVEDLILTAYSHNISVNWKKPTVDSYCVEHYVIEWVHNVSGSKNSSTASNEEDLLVIEDLDACVEYEVSVRAVNDENQSAEAVSNKAKTGTVVPGIVEDLILTAYSHNISVNWKKPTVDSYCVEHYVIEWVHNVSGSKNSSTASNEEDLLVIEDLDACVEYEVSVRAVNDENQSAEAVSNKAKTGTVVPGPVEDLILTAYSHNISVNWKKPTVDSYCVEHYVIEWVHNVSGSKNSSTASNEEDLLVIEDLDACVEYEVSVRAVNDENQSAEAVSNKAKTGTVVPGPVEDLILTAYSHNISVNWKKPTVDSYCVEHYVIEWVHNVSGSKNSSTASNEEDLLVIEDLDACVEYEVSVRAVNDENQSAEAVSNKAKTGTVVPGIVEDLILTAYSHNISVNWKKPTVDSYCVEHYVIEWVHNVSGSKNSSTASNEEDLLVIEDLDACVEYEVSVRAVNDENQSAGAVTNKTRTRTVVPGPVEDLSLTAYLHNISVNWKKPTEDSYCVEQYVIEWVHAVSGSKNSSTASNEEDLLVIEDLDACVEYEVSVRAVNDENQSAEAVSNKAKTGTVVPGIVEDLILTAYSHNISVNWKKPNEDSYCVEQYIIEWVHAVSGSKNSSTASNEEDLLFIEDLDACVEYEVSVRAVNDEIQGAEAVSNKTRTETVVPGQVEDINLAAYSHRISVNWAKPILTSYCVEQYVIEWVHAVSGSKNSSTASNEEDLLVIEDLDACVEYEVSVRAVNDENQSAEAVSNKAKTGTVGPGIVEELILTAYSHNIIVNWKKPTVDSYCVEHYVIEWVHKVSGSKNSSTASNEEDLLFIEDLDACVEYEVSVRAVNDEIQGAEAASNKTRTETVVPGQVEDINLAAYSHRISVNWVKPILTSYCVEQYVIEWVHAVSGSKNSSTASNEEDLLVIEDLDACVEYEVSVRAVNDEIQGAEAVSNKTRTETVVPGQVEDINLAAYSHRISVNWAKPILTSYCVEQYVIEWVHAVSGSKHSSTASNEEDLLVIEDLDACVEYEVSVRAVNNENQSAEAVSNKAKTGTVGPGIVEELILTAYSHNIIVNWKKPTVDSYCVEHYVIEWVHKVSGSKNSSTASNEEDLLFIEDLDACVEYEVSVRAVNDENQRAEAVTNITRTEAVVHGAPVYKDISCLETEKVCLVWNLIDLRKNRCKIFEGTVTCNAEDNPELAVANGVTRDFEYDSFVVNVVGLSPSTTYSCVAYIINESGSSKNSSEVRFTTIPEVPVAMIVGVLFAIIAIGLIAIVVVTYHQGILVWPPAWFTRDKQATVRPQPVLLKKFPEYCAQMLDTPTRLGSEYQLLATLSADISEKNSSDTGQLPENRRKNRYINILPYDATRVTLDLIDGDPNSHYINASFIKGYSNETEYIATQGPKEETCFDFWRMVFQLDVRVIVMVTNLVEQEKVKCHQYYPNRRKSINFGDMTIWCSTQTEFPIHTARTLVLMKGDMKRQLSHLHFREWPDFGVPQSTDVMIDFCQTVRRHALEADGGLILVHCSAGVGQTGTLIAVDILLQHICEKKKVDIFGTVIKLREQRINMVQTEGQYTYIYRCIKDAVEDPTIVNPGTVSNNQLEPIYENVGTSLNRV